MGGRLVGWSASKVVGWRIGGLVGWCVRLLATIATTVRCA